MIILIVEIGFKSFMMSFWMSLMSKLMVILIYIDLGGGDIC